MPQTERVAELMYRFLQQSLPKQVFVVGKSVKLLLEPDGGEDGTIALQLRLAEHERQDRDVEIVRGNAEDARIGIIVSLQALQDCRRIILTATGIPGEGDIERVRMNPALGTKGMSKSGGQMLHPAEPKLPVAAREQDQLNRFHLRP